MNKIIVALTSYPKRLRGIPRVLDSIMAQTYKPDTVVLYLSDEQFADRALPVDLSAYLSQGVEIHWCREDIKSHKKYLYAFREYPDDYIITVDDDYYYDRHMVEEFIRYIDMFPRCVLARRAHLITVGRDGTLSLYKKWWKECLQYIGTPRMDLFAVGCGGILYPPHLFIDEVFNIDCIKKYCLYADDVWLKVMELINDVPVLKVPAYFFGDVPDEEFLRDGLFFQYNKNGGNDRSLHQLLERYDYFDSMKESLSERIFSTGMVYEEEVAEGRKKDNITMAQTYIGGLGRDTDIVIYGAGVVARRIYYMLKQRKKTNKIRAFVVMDTDGNVSDIEGINVVQYKKVDYENAVCVIAIKDLCEQNRVCQRLLSFGLEENQILLLNRRIQMGLQKIIWKQENIH